MRISAPLSLAVLCSAVILSGCGIDSSSVNHSTEGTLALNGVVHGGQQGVKGAEIYLYAAGTAGNASAAHSMLNTPVYTDQFGSFNLAIQAGPFTAPDYSCTNATDQVYIVAVGGDPGVGTPNPSLVMMTALGNCSNLATINYIVINEVTTAAAAWTLAPFMTSYTNVGATSTNAAGLANAFLDAKLLADPTYGVAATDPSNITVEPGKLYALADVLASCINTTGGTACAGTTGLFTAATPTGGSAPTDTLGAALNIVKYPGQNPLGVFNAMSSQPPFPSTMTQAPNDWTITLTITGGGVASPTALDIDANSNVWVGDYSGAISEFSPQGSPLSGTGFGVGDLHEVYGLTIDTYGDIWAANEESSPNAHGSLSKFMGSNTSTPGTVVTGNGGTNFYDSSIDYPLSLSADTNGDIAIGNYANSSATIYDHNGNLVASGWGNADAAFPSALAVDSSHGVWLANLSTDTVTHINSSGTIIANPLCCDGANGIATDSAGNAWVGSYYGNSFSEISSTGSILINQQPIVGSSYSSYPAGVSVDAGQNIWIANYRGESISNIAGINATTPGTVLSPAAGYGYQGPPPATPLLLLPYAVVPDRSGNLWVSNFGNNNLIVFLGLATPTSTPTQPTPTAP